MNYEYLNTLLDKAQDRYSNGSFDEAEHSANQVLNEVDSILNREGGNEILSDETKRTYQILRGSAHITLGRINIRHGDYQTSLIHARAALDLAEENNAIDLKAKALNTIGVVFNQFSDYDNALTYLHKALAINEELGSKEEIARNLTNIGLVHTNLSDFAQALEYYQKSLTIYEELGSTYSIASNFSALGNLYYKLSDYAKALEYHHKALELEEELGNKNGIAGGLHNIGLVYSSLSDNTLAMEYFQKAMIINEETGNKAWLAINLTCIGIVYQSHSDHTKALECYHKSLAINEEIGSKNNIANDLCNIGWLYYRNLSDYATAFGYLQNALAIYEETGNKDGIGQNLCNVGIVYGIREFGGYNPARAEEYLLKSLAISRETGNKNEERESCHWLADFYKNHKRWEEAHGYLEQSIGLEKAILSAETRQQAGLLEQRRQAEEREKQFAVERADAEATKRLLHKTLPKSIADRVIQGELRIADHFESASILFADVVGFTKISSKMPPAAVLAFMNFIFEHFDALAAKHGCERIKTIGDGYLAVCGAPLRYPNHAQRLALMALDMMEDIILPEEIREHLPKGTLFHLRIGLHCGEITAGLIGTGKLAYDIYGDAVNTAARMESHGEAGRIHVSEDFAFHLQNRMDMTNDPLGGIVFEEREEIEIKGKGKMKTCFLEKTIP